MIRGIFMLNFMEELEKFKPILGIDALEEQMATEDLSDVMDIIKEGMRSNKGKSINKNEFSGKEQ